MKVQLPDAVRMVVHVHGRQPIEVDGLKWMADEPCYLLSVDTFDAEGRHLCTQRFGESLRNGCTVTMPAKLHFNIVTT